MVTQDSMSFLFYASDICYEIEYKYLRHILLLDKI